MRLRSLLFVPGDRPERFARAASRGADAICIDLEEAVASHSKAQARRHAIAYLADEHRSEGAGSPIWLRPNPLTTAEGLADLLSLIQAPQRPAGLLLPKCESPDLVGVIIAAFGAVRAPPLVALIETPRGLRRAAQIAAAPGVVGLALGAVDMANAFGAAFDAAALQAVRLAVKAAAAEAGGLALDSACLDIAEPETTRRSAAAAAALGFDGQLAVHPTQVAAIHEAFTPSKAALAEAKALVRRAALETGGVFHWKGAMVDAPVIRSAHRLLERAAC